MAQQTCNHAGCQCSRDEKRRDGFCSDACRDNREAAGKCACGHAQCGK